MLESLFREYQAAGGKGGALSRKFKAYAKTFAGSRKNYRSAFSGEEDSLLRLKPSIQMCDRMSSGFGAVSLSKRADSSLMWSHYAKGHSGYVIGINPKRFIRLDLEKEGRLGEINYSDTRMVMNPRDISDWSEIAFCKSCDWKYEEEWRFHAPFHVGKRKSKNLVVVDYGCENLQEIIIGFKANDELARRIDETKARLPDVTIRFARPSSQTFNMVIENSVPDWLKLGLAGPF